MKLIIKKFNVPVKEMKLEEGREYILGREENCNILLNSENLISRKHLKISQSNNQLWKIECLSELGGLYLDGEMVEGVELDSSVTLSFHEYLFKFIDETEEKRKKEEKAKQEQSLKAVEKPPIKTPPAEADPDKPTKIMTLERLNYCLSISVNGEPSQYADLNEGSCWIVGREEECDIVLENNYLTKRHFEIFKKKEQFTIKDLGSSNGTFLNGKKLQPHVSNNLKSDDLISIGDVKIVFEARSKDFHKLTENVPIQTTTEDSPGGASMALPKVLLEEESGEISIEEATALRRLPAENKKKIILYAAMGGLALAGMLLFGASNKKEENKEVKKEEDKKMQMIENAYQFATVLMSQQKYALCAEELNSLHRLTPYYRDSQQLLVQCQTAVENQKKQDELREREENARKVKEKVAAIVKKCKKQMDTYESVEDLHGCLGDALSLDPGNEEISVMQNTLEHKMEMRILKENERREFEALVQKKRALYNRAKRLKNQGKDLKKAVAPAYRRFLAAAKNLSALKGLYDKASRELQSLEQDYEETLNQLYTNCENFIKSSQMKKAYGECLKIFNFKKRDPKAIAWINQAKRALRDKLKPLYVKSALEESLSNVEEAKELWKQIVQEDVETGYYYKKAKSKLANYK